MVLVVVAHVHVFLHMTESKRELNRKILIIILLSVYIILLAVVTVIVESDSFIEDTLLLTISKEKY